MKVLTWCFIFAVLLVFVCTLNTSDSINVINKNPDGEYTYDQNVAWTYICKDGTCLREKINQNDTRTSLETCSMLCSTPLLWPQPKSVQATGNNSSTFNKSRLTVRFNASDAVEKDLKAAFDNFLNNLPVFVDSHLDDVDITKIQITLNVESPDTKPQFSTNESYSLSVKKTGNDIVIIISASTYFGARHGLETLSQLIWFDTEGQKLRILHDVEISDGPAFPHRGIMVDTARNYFRVEQLLKVLDGMAASKLNVLHLHLTDAVSFPIILPNNPKFAEYGAYSTQMVYTPKDIKGLVEYARIRGIRVILEIDAPSHVNEGWNHGEGELVICGKDDVFNGHLNPDNENVLTVLQSIYEDLLEIGADSETFHLGGDEVNLTCWSDLKAAEGYSDLHDFWADFTNQMIDKVISANRNQVPKNIVLWSSPLTEQKLARLNHSENLVVQYWLGKFDSYLRDNYKVIFSTVGHWYLDCGFGPWRASMTNGVCDPYTPWQTFYDHRPWGDYPEYIDQVLGGEACLWTEQVEVDSLETRIWPRAAAVAERLWSDPHQYEIEHVYTRLASHRERLTKRGIKAAAMWPRWCYQNPGRC